MTPRAPRKSGEGTERGREDGTTDEHRCTRMEEHARAAVARELGSFRNSEEEREAMAMREQMRMENWSALHRGPGGRGWRIGLELWVWESRVSPFQVLEVDATAAVHASGGADFRGRLVRGISGLCISPGAAQKAARRNRAQRELRFCGANRERWRSILFLLRNTKRGGVSSRASARCPAYL